MNPKNQINRNYKIFADINITVQNKKQNSISGVAYKISNKDIRFVSDFKINHGSICSITFKIINDNMKMLTGMIKISRTIDSAYGINKYTMEFDNFLNKDEVNKIIKLFYLD